MLPCVMKLISLCEAQVQLNEMFPGFLQGLSARAGKILARKSTSIVLGGTWIYESLYYPASPWVRLAVLMSFPLLMRCPFAACFHLYAVRLFPLGLLFNFFFVVGRVFLLISRGLFYSVTVIVLHFLEALSHSSGGR